MQSQEAENLIFPLKFKPVLSSPLVSVGFVGLYKLQQFK